MEETLVRLGGVSTGSSGVGPSTRRPHGRPWPLPAHAGSLILRSANHAGHLQLIALAPSSGTGTAPCFTTSRHRHGCTAFQAASSVRLRAADEPDADGFGAGQRVASRPGAVRAPSHSTGSCNAFRPADWNGTASRIGALDLCVVLPGYSAALSRSSNSGEWFCTYRANDGPGLNCALIGRNREPAPDLQARNRRLSGALCQEATCPLKEGTPMCESTDLPNKPHTPATANRARLVGVGRCLRTLAMHAARGAAYAAGSAGFAAVLIWWQTHH